MQGVAFAQGLQNGQSVSQDRYAEARAAQEAGEVDRAEGIYRQLAEEGAARAQFSLANLCRAGEDYTEAYQWTRKAAERGLGLAQFNLALTYQIGAGTPQDLALARHWLREAALQNGGGAEASLELLDAIESLLPLLDRVN